MMRRLAVLSLVLLISSTMIGCESSTPAPTPTPQPTVSPESCSADFTAEPTSGVGTTTVQFADKSTGNVTSWAWDFNGDDVIDSIIQNPTYTYRTNGNFTVSLTITTPVCEDKATKPSYISITGCHT